MFHDPNSLGDPGKGTTGIMIVFTIVLLICLGYLAVTAPGV